MNLNGYASDIHLDFWCREINPQHPKFKRQITRFIKDKLKPKAGKILFISGDIGHHNHQNIELLVQLKEWYEFIVVVHGNHDMYVLTNKQRVKYGLSSFNRVNEMKNLCKDNDIHFLDGDTIEIDGIKICGFSNWYNLETAMELYKWKTNMNDSNHIMDGAESHIVQIGYGREKITSFDPQKYYQTQLEHLERFTEQKCDILVSHVCPINIPDEHICEDYLHDADNIFYMVDQEELVQKTGASLVLFGHQHDINEFNHNGIDYKINAVGYPGEGQPFNGIKHFDIRKS